MLRRKVASSDRRHSHAEDNARPRSKTKSREGEVLNKHQSRVYYSSDSMLGSEDTAVLREIKILL